MPRGIRTEGFLGRQERGVELLGKVGPDELQRPLRLHVEVGEATHQCHDRAVAGEPSRPVVDLPRVVLLYLSERDPQTERDGVPTLSTVEDAVG